MESPTRENSSPERDDEPRAAKASCKNNARRFSDEQIKSLESIFKIETKLEPRKKVQLARELGLEPRQVAIWFQNRRARWKSKQLEQEYKVLRANYDSLRLRFDDLKREKECLQMQLHELSNLVTNLDDQKANLGNNGDCEFKEYPNSSNEGNVLDHDYDTINKCLEKNRQDHQELLLVHDEEEEMSHFASPETWCNLSSWWEM